MEENRTILIVDDEPETLNGYAEFLGSGGQAKARRSSRSQSAGNSAPSSSTGEQYRLLMAASGEEAVKKVTEEIQAGGRIAAGFFDVKLGAGMDGLATILAIRKLEPGIHCAVVTAYHDRTVEEINQLFGEDFKDHWDYLNKPFTQGEIVQKARQMVSAWNRRRQLEAMHTQLVRSERMAAIGQVARGVGHEFGNILLRIMGKADLALLEKDPEKVKAHLQVVLSASERAGVIVRNLQSFSKFESNFQFARLSKPIEQAVSLINHELTKASVKLSKELRQDPDLRIDTGALGQVFLNLFINAIHAMPKGGTLQVTVDEEAGPAAAPGVAVRVADTGSGIPKDALSRIFEFAFTTKGDQGSGLGLSISREIMESHGGTIEVESTSPQGTVFRLWLPLRSDQ